MSYENYDLLRTDMMRCKNVKDFNIYHPTYGNLSKCTTVSAADSDQTLKQESYSAYAQDALYLTDKWIAVAGLRYQYYTQYAGKGRPFNVNTDSRDEQWTPKLGLVYKLTPSVSLFANYSQTFMPQSSIASYIGDLPPETSNAYEVGLNLTCSMALPPTLRCLIFTSATCCTTKAWEVKPSPKPLAAYARREWRWILPDR